MQQDKLYEESAITPNPKTGNLLYNIFQAVAITLWVMAAICAFFATSAIREMFAVSEEMSARVVGVLSWVVLILLLAVTGFVLWKLRDRFNVSYDYEMVDDEVRITKIFNGRRRRPVTTLRADGILRIGVYETDPYYAALRSLNGKKPRFLTPNRTPAEEKQFIYVFVSGSIEKTLYILECRQEFLERLVRIAGVMKWERA